MTTRWDGDDVIGAQAGRVIADPTGHTVNSHTQSTPLTEDEYLENLIELGLVVDDRPVDES